MLDRAAASSIQERRRSAGQPFEYTQTNTATASALLAEAQVMVLTSHRAGGVQEGRQVPPTQKALAGQSADLAHAGAQTPSLAQAGA
jgi:hypothetical protein